MQSKILVSESFILYNTLISIEWVAVTSHWFTDLIHLRTLSLQESKVLTASLFICMIYLVPTFRRSRQFWFSPLLRAHWLRSVVLFGAQQVYVIVFLESIIEALILLMKNKFTYIKTIVLLFLCKYNILYWTCLTFLFETRDKTEIRFVMWR